MSSPKSHITGMAGEFFVMEKLFRLGHEASLTLGNAKTVDIFTQSPSGNVYQVSVKAIRGGGKWGVGTTDYSQRPDLVFALLQYRTFEDILSLPDIWIVPGADAEKLKQPWFDKFGIYCANKAQRARLEPFRNAWRYLE